MWMNNIYYGYPFFGGMQNPEIVFGTSKRSYTIRIEEWLKTKHPMLDPLDSDQLLEAGLDTVFKNMNLNVLSDQYKETFMIQFLNQFYMNEIGQETTDFFRQNLNKVIQNHGQYIKSLYELAEKKYFIDYSMRVTEGEHQEITESEGTKNNESKTTTSSEHADTGFEEHSSEGTGKDSSSGTNNTDVTQDTEDTKNYGRTTKDTQSGSDKVGYGSNDTTQYGSSNTNTVTNMKTDMKYGKTDAFAYDANGEFITRNGEEKDTHNMKHHKNGKETTGGYDETEGTGANGQSMRRHTEYNGSETSTDTFNNYTSHHETERTYDNYEVLHNQKNSTVQKFSDTPQNGLAGMGYSEGTGEYGEGGGNYGDGYDEYMSSAQINTQVVGSKDHYNGSYKDAGDDTQSGSKVTEREFGNDRYDESTEYESRRTEIERNLEFTNRYDYDDGTITKSYNNWKESKGGGHKNTLSGTDSQTVNGSQKNELSGSDTVKHSGEDTTTYGKVSDVVEGGKDTGTGHMTNSTQNETSNERNTENTEKGTRSTQNGGTASGTSESNGYETSKNNGTANGTNKSTEEHYSYNRDAVFMSNDITDKIWELFDECFMQVL